jgi:hypothetical protein
VLSEKVLSVLNNKGVLALVSINTSEVINVVTLVASVVVSDAIDAGGLGLAMTVVVEDGGGNATKLMMQI